MSISYEPEGPPNNDMMYYMFDQNGRKLEEFKLEAPYFGMTHDIAFTEKWVIAVVTPNLISDEEKLKRGHQFYEWNDDAPLAFGLIPRRNPTPDKVKWYLYKNAYGIHTGNAFDADDGSVILDIPVADSNRVSLSYHSSAYAQLANRKADVLFQCSRKAAAEKCSGVILLPFQILPQFCR